MNGGLYRSAHAARDGDRRRRDGVTLISVDDAAGATAAGDQALPPEDVPPAGAGDRAAAAPPATARSWRSAAWSAG